MTPKGILWPALALLAAGSAAAAPADGRLTYSNGTTTPQSRAYTGGANTFAAAAGTQAGTAQTWFLERAAPARTEHLAGYVTAGGVLNILRWNGTAWSSEWTATVGGNGVDGRRFDIAYEGATGNALVVYSNNTNSTLAYRTWNGSAWSAATTQASARLTGVPNSIKLAARPVAGSNAIAATVADANNLLTTLIWSGAAWGNEPAAAHGTLNGTAGQNDLWDQAWETTTGDLMVVFTTSTPNQAWRLFTFATSSWGATTNFPNTGRAAPLQMSLSSDPGSDQMVVGFNRSGSASIYAYQWSGTAWSTGTAAIATTGATPAIEQRTITTSWLRSGATSVAVLFFNSTTGTNQIDWLFFNGTAWTAGTPYAPAGGFGNNKIWMDAASDPQSPDRLLLTFSTSASSLWAKRLVYGGGTTFTWSDADGGASLGTIASATTQNFDFAYDRISLAAPGAPGTPTYSAIGSAAVTVSWTAAAGATSYNLQRATDSAFTLNLTTISAATSPYADSLLNGNATYWYRVVAVNAVGSTTGAGSSVLTLPAAPAAPTYASVAQTTLSVSWAAPAGGAASYNLQRADDSGFTVGLTTVNGATSPFPASGLTANTTYWYRAIAVNASGSTAGASSSVTTLANPPGAPGTPAFSNVAGTSLTVSWTAAAGATSYNLQRATDGAFTLNLTTISSVTSPYGDTGLTGNTTWWYRVVAVNSGGSVTGAASSVLTLPGPPGAPTYGNVTQTSVTVSWTAPAGGAASYNLQRATDSAFSVGLTTFAGATSPFNDAGPLAAGTTYWYRAVAVTAAGSTIGASSSVATVPPPPGAPGAPSYSNVAGTSVTVSWTAGANATSHDLQRATDSAFTLNMVRLNSVTSPYNDGGLSAGTTYWYRAIAINGSGTATGASSSVITASANALTVASGTQPAGASLAAGTAGTVVGRVQLTASAGTITVTSLLVNNTGTTAPGDLQALQLLDDASGAWLGSGSWTGSQWRFRGLSLAVTGTRVLRLVLALSSGATPGNTFQMQVPAGAVTVAAPDTVNAFVAFNGGIFTVAAGATEGDPTANSTGPMVRIVNPGDGATVSLTPAAPAPAPNNAFRVQVYVYNPGGLAALTSVSLSTDNGATWPIALARNANYEPGSTVHGIWEAIVTTLTPGTWTLRARAVNAVPKTVVSGPVVIAVNPARRGDGNLLVRDNSSQLCTDCHALATHSSENTSSKYGSWATNCRDCHTPHNTTNIYVVKKSITPPAVNGFQSAKTVKFSTTTGDSNSSAAASASYANSDNSGPCQVCHTRTSDATGTVARWRNSGNADAHYSAAAGTQRCTNCHSHVSGFAGGESKGGAICGGCHRTIFQAMNGTTAKAYKHTLGAVSGTNDAPGDSGLTWGNPLSANLPAGRSCVNMCHLDHVHNDPATGTSHSFNANQDATSLASRQVTRNASGVVTAGTPDRTDFEGGPGYGTNANGGMCLSCHRNPVDANHPAVDKVAYDFSAHDYTNFGAYGPWQYTLHEGSVFNRNCTKCHADRGDAQNDSTTPFGAVHFSDYPSLLTGSTNPAGAPATFVCYNCHGNGATGANLSGKDIASEIAKAGANHPVNADAVHNTVSESSAAYNDGKFTGANRHVNCVDCHDQHAAAEFNHLVGTNAVANGAPYTTGTATFTSASTAVTGAGTTWTPYAGWKIRNDADGKWYQVASVASATSLTLAAAYTGATATGVAYTIAPSSPLASATGVTYAVPTANWTTPPAANFAFTASVTAEYQVCFKCHSSFGFGGNPVASPSGATYTTGTATFTNGSTTVTGAGANNWSATAHVDMVIKNNADGTWYLVTAVPSATSLTLNRAYAGATATNVAYTLQERETDVALEFATTNQSYHPVMGALPATDPGANGSSTLTDAQLTLPWRHGTGPSKTMYCSDCHGNDANAAVVQGPHGSAAKWLLAGPNVNWPTTTQGGATLYNLGNNPTNNTFLAGLFCLNCHPMRDNSASNTQAAWANNAVHYNHSGPQVGSVECIRCHILVPHGGKLGRLIATNSAGMPQRYAWQGNLANVYVTQFIKTAPGSYNTPNCNTSCGGHGTVTGGAADLPVSW